MSKSEELRQLVTFHSIFGTNNDSKDDFNAEEVGHQFDELISDKENTTGDFYKGFYASKAEDEYAAPKGNNLLLQIIAGGAFEPDLQRKNLAEQLAKRAIIDAKKKLTNEEFKNFINFEFKGDEEWYQNSPFTLAAKNSMLDICEILVANGADIYAKTGEEHGAFTPAEILASQTVFLPQEQRESYDKLLTKIKEKYDTDGKETNTIDEILQLKPLLPRDMHCFKMLKPNIAEEVNLDYPNKLSFSEIKLNAKFCDYFENITGNKLPDDFFSFTKMVSIPPQMEGSFAINNSRIMMASLPTEGSTGSTFGDMLRNVTYNSQNPHIQAEQSLMLAYNIHDDRDYSADLCLIGELL